MFPLFNTFWHDGNIFYEFFVLLSTVQNNVGVVGGGHGEVTETKIHLKPKRQINLHSVTLASWTSMYRTYWQRSIDKKAMDKMKLKWLPLVRFCVYSQSSYYTCTLRIIKWFLHWETATFLLKKKTYAVLVFFIAQVLEFLSGFG